MGTQTNSKFTGLAFMNDPLPCGHVEPHGESLCGEESFDESFTKEDFCRFFEDGKKSSVMDADAALQQRKNVLHLGQGAVLFRQNLF